MDIDAPKPSATLHPRPSAAAATAPAAHPLLPTLLHTPGGLALLELQGAFNLPAADVSSAGDAGDAGDDGDDGDAPASAAATPAALAIGRLEFPDYDPAAGGAASTAWMGRVHLYVGPHQRLTGEAKKLPRPVAVVRRRRRRAVEEGGPANDENNNDDADDADDDEGTNLEMVDVIHYKLLFSQRPEPMTESHALE